MVQELPRIAVGAGNGEDQVVEMVSTSGGEHQALPTAACYMFIYQYQCIQTEQPQVKLCMTMPLLMYDEYHPGTRDKDSSPAKRPKMSAIVRECFWYYVKCLGSVDSVCSLELLYHLFCFIHPRYKEVQNYITEQLVEQHDPIGARNGVGHTTCRFLAVRLFYYQQQPVGRLVG